MRDFCCEEFAREVQTPKHMKRMERNEEDGTWRVYGCCQNCYVLDDIKFCPFCGSRLAGKEEEAA